MTVQPARPVLQSTERTDPRPARSRESILDAALEHFLEHGYLASTVEAIAVRAHLAKRTVYNLFPTKEELFRAVIHRATETSERFVIERVQTGIGEREVGEELAALAVEHARAVLAPRVVATRRLLISESQRFPELAIEYFERVPSTVIRAIAARLERYDALGLLSIRDSQRAAEHFAYLVLGSTLDRALFTPGGIASNLIDSAATAGAGAFLRAYRAAYEK